MVSEPTVSPLPSVAERAPKPICMVTGATRGIGHAVAIDLARRGYQTVIVARSEPSAEAARRAIVSASGGGEVHALVGDLASQASVREVASRFSERFLKLDVLVNNAAVFEPAFAETVDGVERHLAINYLAPFLLTHLLLPSLAAAGPARVVNVSGETARFGSIRLGDLERRKSFSMVGAYAQSKLAQILFTRTLAERLASRRITVNALHPGMVATSHLEHGPRLLNRFWSTALPGPASAVRAVVRLCVSPAVAQVTGAYYLGRLRFVPPFSAFRRSLREELYERSLTLVGLESSAVSRIIGERSAGRLPSEMASSLEA